VIASDFLGREKFIAAPHQMIALRGRRAEDPKDHRANGAEYAAQKKGLHQPNPSKIELQISARTFPIR
jgi:hypothetical protein